MQSPIQNGRYPSCKLYNGFKTLIQMYSTYSHFIIFFDQFQSDQRQEV